MIKFGPSGNEEMFYMEHDSSSEAPEYLSELGLDIYEYGFTHGINLKDETAIEIGRLAKKFKIEISAHAPYYINLGNPSDESLQKAYMYLSASISKLNLMGGNRVVVHIGSTGKEERAVVFERIKKRLVILAEQLKTNYNNFTLFFEVMGRYSQIGNLDEILELANLDEHFNICVDFGHLNCLMQGALNSETEMEKAVLKIINGLPPKKHKNFHVHFSKILFNDKGEVKHLNTIKDDSINLDFEILAKILKKYSLSPWIICESKTLQAQDAALMKKIYKNC